ncbi:MAG: DUF5683 domain-containing protein [Croceivirga sp.]
MIQIAWSQVEQDSIPEPKPVDSLRTDLKSKGITVEEVSFVKKEINPLAPSKAAFYSAIFPGLGQIYNKRYWKAPIVWGAIGWGTFQFVDLNNQYGLFRNAFKDRRVGIPNEDFERFSDESLQSAQERLQRDRDLWLVVTIGFYALNIIDANVDAHLKQYNVNEQLGYEIKPYFNFNEVTNDPNFGLAVIVTF